MPIKDITGFRSGKLIAIRFDHVNNRKAIWLCRCDCGQEKLVNSGNLKTGNSKSCGCSTKAKKHGMHDTKVYSSWEHMKDRCLNPNNDRYDRYGGRGIKVYLAKNSFLMLGGGVGLAPIAVARAEEPEEVTAAATEGSMENITITARKREETLQRLRKAVMGLTARYPEIERAILFGSLARGDAVPGSDADLLLILRESELPFPERSIRYWPAGAGVGVDVFAYTRKELAALLEADNSFVAQALREGITLVTSPTCRP